MRSRIGAALMCAGLMGAVVGCGTEADTSSDSAANSATANTTTPKTTTPSATTPSSPGNALTIEVSIEAGSVAPTNERIEAVVGEPIAVRVDSDAADELHVHSVPDHTFDIEAAQGQVFEFVVDVPGQVALELHDSGRTIATLLVRP